MKRIRTHNEQHETRVGKAARWMALTSAGFAVLLLAHSSVFLAPRGAGPVLMLLIPCAGVALLISVVSAVLSVIAGNGFREPIYVIAALVVLGMVVLLLPAVDAQWVAMAQEAARKTIVQRVGASSEIASTTVRSCEISDWTVEVQLKDAQRFSVWLDQNRRIFTVEHVEQWNEKSQDWERLAETEK